MGRNARMGINSRMVQKKARARLLERYTVLGSWRAVGAEVGKSKGYVYNIANGFRPAGADMIDRLGLRPLKRIRKNWRKKYILLRKAITRYAEKQNSAQAK
jgi:hypothetical protein